jgi:DNA invertase Pin-like site-specific DNA recombinase
MVFGYARVSTKDQNLDSQIDALKKAGVDKIYEEKISGGRVSRPVLDDLLEYARKGDFIVVYDLSRLGRNLRHLLELVEDFKTKGIHLKILNGFGEGPIDTSTASGSLVFNMFALVSDFQRQQIKEKTVAGLKAARKRGRLGGRPKVSSSKVTHAIALYDSGKYSVKEIEKTSGISRATLYRELKKQVHDPKKERTVLKPTENNKDSDTSFILGT